MTPAGSGTSLRSVLDAVAAAEGGTTVGDLARTTGLDEDLVRLALQQLVTIGRLGSSAVSLSCAGGGCGTCPTSTGACGTASSSSLVALTLIRRDGSRPHL